MKKPLFTGSGVAIVMPFTKETVDLPTLGKLLDFQMKNGTDAIIVCGTTGEASTMSYRERMRTIEFCVDHVDGRLPVIAGTGSNSTENALALSRDAERAGADGLLLVTPYYNKASQAGLIRHFQVIADGVDVPLILYDVPSRTGVSIAPVPQCGATLSEGKTKPPKPFSEATLLAAMEHASRWVEDKDLKAALDDDESHSGGIGTPATRADVIEKLIRTGYVDRKGKQLLSLIHI